MTFRDLCFYVGGFIIGWAIGFFIPFFVRRNYKKELEDILKQEYD